MTFDFLERSLSQWTLLLSSSLLLGFALSAALGNGLVGYPSGEWFYAFLDPICHQFPTLSFWIANHPLGLCARCTGGYIGVAFGALVGMQLIQKFGVQATYSVFITGFVLAVLEALIHLSDDNVWRALSGFLGGASSAVVFLCLAQVTKSTLRRFKSKFLTSNIN